MSGLIDIATKKKNKVNAKTRITSDQSKIVPKNTTKREEFGHPYYETKTDYHYDDFVIFGSYDNELGCVFNL